MKYIRTTESNKKNLFDIKSISGESAIIDFMI